MPFRNLCIFTLFSFFVFSCVNASPKNKDTGACKFENYNAEHELKSIERIRPLIGKTYTSHDGLNGYDFTVGICANLGLGPKDAAVVQIEKTAGQSDTLRSIGNLMYSHIMAGSDWAYLEYKHGEPYKQHCGQQPKRTTIILSCDENVGDAEAKMVYVEEERHKTEDCYYLFEMKHKALCPVYTSGSSLSIGSIVVIIFISVLAVYVVIGFIYQRFVLGSKGVEQIPNYEFWKDFGNLQADGCDLVCRTRERQNVGFGGIGDEQLEQVEEPRDDNLLPM